MEADVVTAAKQYQESHEWENAISCYETYKREQENIERTVYVSYATCLRNAGRISEAKALLLEGAYLYPNTEPIFQELYALYKKIGKWHQAKSTAEKLIHLAPQKGTYYFQLGRACAFLKDDSNAKQAYLSGLKLRHNLSYTNLVETIKRGFTAEPAEFSSEYVFLNGKNNYGAIMHYKADRTYITKISKYDKNAKREAAFYRDICSKFPQLKQIAPAYIDSQVKDRILYLTIEWLEGSEVTSRQTTDLIDTAHQISSVPYQSIIYTYPNPAYLFQFRNKPTFIIQFFTQIHKKNYNEKLFSELYQLIKQNHYPASTYDVVHKLESLIMPDCLYGFIDPRKHYSLLHGDFHPANMKVTKPNQAIKVFDWASFTTGPHFVDIARYLTKALIPYQEVKTLYLHNEQTGGKLTLIERIFFLYALILLYVLRLKARDVEKYMACCIDPALEEMEDLVTQFKEEAYASSLVKLRDEKEERHNQVELLEDQLHRTTKRNQALKKQVHHLEKQNKQITESKSWKITAPLRKLKERWGKGGRKR